jgi:hypothetical protein
METVRLVRCIFDVLEICSLNYIFGYTLLLSDLALLSLWERPRLVFSQPLSISSAHAHFSRAFPNWRDN